MCTFWNAKQMGSQGGTVGLKSPELHGATTEPVHRETGVLTFMAPFLSAVKIKKGNLLQRGARRPQEPVTAACITGRKKGDLTLTWGNTAQIAISSPTFEKKGVHPPGPGTARPAPGGQ